MSTNMKRENIKLLTIIVVGLFIYLLFFIETVEDAPLEKPTVKKERLDTKKDSIQQKDTIR